ncbi:MAG TPA: cell envelope integrity protein TolA [Woeseiaceae bacterium]|nr:cell envelope integrity protein TolA [Woeseiaceae bacterium]
MIRDEHNVIPVLLAILLHAGIFAAMVVAFDWSRPIHPPTPLAIEATLVTEAQLPPTREELRREAEERARQEAREAEERARQEALEAEQQRIREEQAAERRRLEQEAAERQQREAAEKERQRQEAEERRQREEAELERRRQEAERKRLEEIERQRRENELARAAAEAEARQKRLQEELAAEAERQEAMSSGELARYKFAIQQRIMQNWIKPASARPGLECVINVRQVPGGEVISATIERCNGDAAVQRSIEAAVFKASPLPEPSNPALFERNLRITFKPEQ